MFDPPRLTVDAPDEVAAGQVAPRAHGARGIPFLPQTAHIEIIEEFSPYV